MKIITDEQIRCVKPIGKLDANSCNELDMVLAALPENGRDIILDMSECPYVSSAGIRIILMTKKRLQVTRNELFIAGMLPDVFHVFEMAGLQRVFRFEASVEASLAAIQQDSNGRPDIRDIAAGDHLLHYEHAAEASVTGQLCLSPDLLSYDELGFALGIGSLSDTAGTVAECTDFFVTLENCSGFLPLDPAAPPDFRIISDPLKTGLRVCEAISFGHKPTGSMKLTTPGMLTFTQLNNAIHSLDENTFEKGAVILRILVNQRKTIPP